jgi:hypothetical protein
MEFDMISALWCPQYLHLAAYKNMRQFWNLFTNISEFHLQVKEATFTAKEGNRLFQIVGNQNPSHHHYKSF